MLAVVSGVMLAVVIGLVVMVVIVTVAGVAHSRSFDGDGQNIRRYRRSAEGRAVSDPVAYGQSSRDDFSAPPPRPACPSRGSTRGVGRVLDVEELPAGCLGERLVFLVDADEHVSIRVELLGDVL